MKLVMIIVGKMMMSRAFYCNDEELMIMMKTAFIMAFFVQRQIFFLQNFDFLSNLKPSYLGQILTNCQNHNSTKHNLNCR